MRVYFIGAHATGKTTLARYVSENYQLPMITEVARMVLSEKELHLDTLRYDTKAVSDYQKQIFYRQLREEEKLEHFVSDRSFDCLAYAAQHTDILPELIGTPDLSEYLSKLRRRDTYTFFVRPSKATLRSDGVREQISWDGIVSIDAMIKFMLQMWQLKHFQISVDNMQERVQLINAVLPQNK